MLQFIESFLNELNMTAGSCSPAEIEEIINANLPYFRRKFMRYYFDGVETFSDIENCTLEEIYENFSRKNDLGHKELYYISSNPFKLTPLDKKLLTRTAKSLTPEAPVEHSKPASCSYSDYPSTEFSHNLKIEDSI